MPRILQLPPDVVTKIAAGEVIERPASVVKELLENSIDAGATRIDIDLDAGGTELIRVVDDGCGIDPDDLPLAFAQHATSKLETADDLFRIGTMGFRGEALASIAGVGQVTLQSRTHAAASGCEIKCDGGALSPAKPWNGSPGTRIEVRHLFYNVPVRKKFLKSVATELGHVCEIVTRLALANPALHLTLRHNGRLVYDIPGSAGLLDRIGLFFTGDVRDALYELDSGPGPLRLTGFVADPKCDRGNAKLQYLFVNGRWFRDRSLGARAARGLPRPADDRPVRGRLPVPDRAAGQGGRERPPDEVGGAVPGELGRLLAGPRQHQAPAASREPGPAAHGASGRRSGHAREEPGAAASPCRGCSSPRREVAERTLAPWERGELADPFWRTPDGVRLPGGPTPLAPLPEGKGEQEPPPNPLPEGRGLLNSPPFREGLGVGSSEPTPAAPLPEGREEPLAASREMHTFREAASGSLGPPSGAGSAAFQLHDSYLVLETADGMLVIDQHALHERILFEQLRRRIRDGKLEVQRLLIPEPIDLPAEQAALVLEAADALRELGLDVSDFGGNTILLSSYPTLLGRKRAARHPARGDRPPGYPGAPADEGSAACTSSWRRWRARPR